MKLLTIKLKIFALFLFTYFIFACPALGQSNETVNRPTLTVDAGNNLGPVPPINGVN